MRSTPRIAPSILAADFANLQASIDEVASYVDLLHLDVMDGHFVPNITIGPPVISSLAQATDLYLDCHLMITDPLSYIQPLAEAGANGVTVHIEAVPDPRPAAREAQAAGLDFGIVINPPTPVEAIEPFLELANLIVVMSVNPGFGGQSFIEASLPKIAQLREIIDSQALAADIEIDGGIDLQTAGPARRAGADVFVAGTSIFRAENPASAAQALRAILEGE